MDSQGLNHSNRTDHPQIRLLNAKDLPAKDSSGFSDPYFRFSIGPSQVRSSTRFQTLNPTFDEELTLSSYDDVADLAVHCYDEDKFSVRDDFIGSATLQKLSATFAPSDVVQLKLLDGPIPAGVVFLRIAHAHPPPSGTASPKLKKYSKINLEIKACTVKDASKFKIRTSTASVDAHLHERCSFGFAPKFEIQVKDWLGLSKPAAGTYELKEAALVSGALEDSVAVGKGGSQELGTVTFSVTLE
jgi:hypothetical protein